MKRLRIGVLYGGRSGEHEVSIASAAAVFANLDRDRYEPIPIRIERDGRWLLADRPPSAASAADVIERARTEAGRARPGRDVFMPPRPGDETLIIVDRRRGDATEAEAPAALTGLGLDVMFPVLHGPHGEDGTIQGLLELANVAYVGSGVLASAVGMDKSIMKQLFRANGLRTPDWVAVTHTAWARDAAAVRAAIETRLPYPVFVKPANLGSSVGISKVHGPAALPAAIELALGFDLKLVIEAGVVDAREIECGVLGNDDAVASVPGEIVPAREFYDYEAKYLDAGSRIEIPATLDPDLVSDVRRLAVNAFTVIGASGLARVDFLLARASNDLYVNEINTMPGFTTISMFAKLWEASGVAYAALVDRLIALAIERHRAKQQLHIAARA